MATGDLIEISRDHCSRLAHEWCNRLAPVAGERRRELGFALVEAIMDGPDA